MTKYSIEERIAAVRAVEGGESIAGAARRYGIDKRVVSRDIRMVEAHGEEGLSRSTRAWTAEEKCYILEYMRANKLTCLETGIHFGIKGTATVWNWEQRYLKNGIKGLEDKKKGRKPKAPKPKPPKTREEELLERITYLEAENEYLKKLNALVVERERQEKESK